MDLVRRVERDDRAVGNALRLRLPVARARGERRAYDHAVADDERGQRVAFDAFERVLDTHLLVRERLSAGKRERRIPGCERVEKRDVFSADVLEAAVGPIARIGLHQPRVLFGLEAEALRDDVGGFARAQQRAAPQGTKAVGARVLGELGGLRAPGLVERNRLLALEAALEVVGRLPVPREIDSAFRHARSLGEAARRGV